MKVLAGTGKVGFGASVDMVERKIAGKTEVGGRNLVEEMTEERVNLGTGVKVFVAHEDSVAEAVLKPIFDTSRKLPS